MTKQNSQNTKCLPLAVFEAMRVNSIEYVYIGEFTPSITDSILSLAELNLETGDDSVKLKKRVYFILVEGLQNVTRHQQYEEYHAKSSGMLLIQRFDDNFVITTANYIRNSEIAQLKQYLDKINSLNKEELKDLYRKALADQRISPKGGAGLGLIEIARKSGNKLRYSFERIDDDYSIFYFQTKISLPTEDEFEAEESNELDNIKKVHKFLLECDVVLSFAGIFMQDKLVYMLSILEKRIKKDVILKSKVFGIIVELLQNITNHSDSYVLDNISGHYAIFYIAEDVNTLRITTGNYIKRERIEKLQKNLEFVNSLSLRDLAKKHYEILKNYKRDKTNRTTGLGLFNIRMKAKQKLNFYFVPVDDQYAFFSLEVSIQKKHLRQKSLSIEPTRKTPRIYLSMRDARFLFEGVSLPDNADEFYKPVLEWFSEYIKGPRNFTVLHLRLEDLNEDTEKFFIRLFEMFDDEKIDSVVIVKFFVNEKNPKLEQLYEKVVGKFKNIEFQLIKNNNE